MQGVVELSGLFTKEQCAMAIADIESVEHGQSAIISSPLLIQKYSDIIMPQLMDYYELADGRLFQVNFIGDDITFGKQYKAIKAHVDAPHGRANLMRLLVYLDALAGTQFTNKNTKEECSIVPQIGCGIAFDISLLHRGLLFPAGAIKYIISFRLYGVIKKQTDVTIQ